jgi:hypothetical protein
MQESCGVPFPESVQFGTMQGGAHAGFPYTTPKERQAKFDSDIAAIPTITGIDEGCCDYHHHTQAEKVEKKT